VFGSEYSYLSGVFNAVVLASYPFSTIGTIVDVGGGDGTFIVALLQANPGMKGVLVDLPHVAEKAKKRMAETGLSARCEVVAGDAFASVPRGGDAYILSRVIQDWDDDRAIAILKNCSRAMTNGKLLLVEPVLPDGVDQSIAVQCSITFGLSMMVMTGGRERTVAEHRALFKAAGFELRRIIPTDYVMSVVEGTRS
jgi:hypothetical protein